MTDNHKYKTAKGNAADWWGVYNENIGRLDTDIEIRDSESNLGTYKPNRGAKFLALDTENKFIGEGDRWRALTTSGRSPTVDSVQLRSLSNTVIYAANYDTIQEALDDATNGETVVLPGGTTTIQNPPILVSSKVTVQGSRSGSILKLPDGANTHAITIAEGSIGVSLKDFRIDANGANQDTTIPRGDLHVIQKEPGASSVLYQNLTIIDAAKGAAIANAGGNDIVIIGCDGYRGGKNGEPCDFVFNNLVTSLRMSGCYAENFTDTGMAQDNVRNTIVYGNIFKDFQSQAISFVMDSTGGAIVGNQIVNAGALSDGGIVVGPFGTNNRPTELVVANNTVHDCQTNGIFVEATHVGTIGNVVAGNDGSGIVYRGGTYGGIIGNIVVDNGTSTTPAPGILIQGTEAYNSVHNVVGMNVMHNTGDTQSYGIETANPTENFNTFVGNSASGHTRQAWNVSGRGNRRVGNSPPMPLATGTVSLTPGGAQVVWSDPHFVHYPSVSLLALSGRGQADSYVTTDEGRTQIGVREIGRENPIEVQWAVWP
ncbi:right-handed parallel beta-helix repeat-containing protein [Haladaptatus caseinilyticus]|uniref:right-handed parallel beta-helix repeat-containing protein n=1 Tax=Haladaptatus caseinilyticus TaxID=2993314 RepID=UPI00224A85B1|nr:right-handed parallel beta-helix repeat-containing protein [Haladaptatus caseinilyticus]